VEAGVWGQALISHGRRARFWLEGTLACVTGLLLLLTLVWRNWIESTFGVDPDHGSGSSEWVIVGFLAVATVALVVLARVEWARARADDLSAVGSS